MQLDILLWVQSFRSPVLDWFFQALTILGEPVVAVTVLLAVYWLWDREKGEFLIFSVVLSLLCNNVCKELVKAPRPIGEPGLFTLRAQTATGYSFPSGHTQNAATLSTGLLLLRPRRWTAWLYVALTVGVAVSRMYLGVHWPADVAFGLLFGVAAPFAARWLMRRFGERRAPLCYLAVALAALPFCLLADGGQDLIKAVGLGFGFALGTMLEHRWIRFTTPKTCGGCLLRLVAGVAGLAIFYLPLKLLGIQAAWFSMLRYFVLAFSATALLPWLFTRLKI